jgi:predicted alpha/beta hydrolase
MAKPTVANAKTQAAAIATALNSALSDTVLTGIFPDWKEPGHPMRKWQNFVKMDDQGTFTANDAYIDAAYADSMNPGVAFSEKDNRVTNAPS